MKYFILSLPLLIISSCGVSNNQRSDYVPPDTLFSVSGEASYISSGTIHPKVFDQNSKESIESIQTLDDITGINPIFATDPKKDHPKFVELQKKKLLLGLAFGLIKDPKYFELQSKQSDILLARELWTPEILKADKDLIDLITQTSGTGGTSQKISDALAKKNRLMQEFHLTAVFIRYANSHKSELDTITESMKEYLSPEIIQLQQDIEKLNIEIYNPSSI